MFLKFEERVKKLVLVLAILILVTANRKKAVETIAAEAIETIGAGEDSKKSESSN